MPTAILVSGPTKIEWNNGSGWFDLGFTDNDNLPQISWNDHSHEVRTVVSGATPEEIILHNTEAAISFTLVRFDPAELVALEARQRGAVGTTTVGRRLVNDNGTFGIRITPLTVGRTQYSFGRCFMAPNALVRSQFGNVELRAGLTIKAIPDANNLLYSTATTT